MKKAILTAIALIIFSGVNAIVFSSGTTDADEYETIDNTVFKNPSRPAAIFNHDEHNELAELEDDCSVCHHVYEGKTKIEDESSEDSYCSECHQLKPNQKNSVSLRKAFHEQCRSCHFQRKKGPVLCGECHIN